MYNIFIRQHIGNALQLNGHARYTKEVLDGRRSPLQKGKLRAALGLQFTSAIIPYTKTMCCKGFLHVVTSLCVF